MLQRTINEKIVFDGIGVHTGLKSTVILLPAGVDHGIVFKNPNFPEESIRLGEVVPEIALHASVLKSKSFIVSTIEHLIAALSAFRVDNIIIEMESLEVPILDGSCSTFVNLIKKAGIKECSVDKIFLTPVKELRFNDLKLDREIIVAPAANKEDNTFDCSLYFNYIAEFEHPLVGKGSLRGSLTTDYFINEIAAARTFGFLEQLAFLRRNGLAKGSSLGNTVVVGEDEFLNTPRFEDEFVRHKLLDLIGDLGLLGKNLAGTITAKKTGHSFNRLVILDYIKNPENWIQIK